MLKDLSSKNYIPVKWQLSHINAFHEDAVHMNAVYISIVDVSKLNVAKNGSEQFPCSEILCEQSLVFCSSAVLV